MAITLYFLIFVFGEILVNITFFRYLKKYFKVNDKTTKNDDPFLGMNISTFKGTLERFLLFFGLILDFPQVIILFGALKIGTRFEKNDKVQNDYFLIGNFSSVLCAITYYFCHKLLLSIAIDLLEFN